MNVSAGGKAGQQAQFESRLNEHRGILYKVVGTYAWLAEDQQDLAQEITLQLWRSFARYDDSRKFSTWMYQVALNVAISWARKAKLRRTATVPEAVLENNPEVPADEQDSSELYALIDGLDELNRALLILTIEERSHAEIGEILGITPINVATKISRLKARLRLEVAEKP
jgi:RNA polymerase sigma-70 factor (ECF subfamily)